MTATRSDVSIWFDDGVRRGFEYMIVAFDEFEHAEYPVYLHSEEVVAKVKEINSRKMYRVLEVYDLSADKDKQLSSELCWRTPKANAQ